MSQPGDASHPHTTHSHAPSTFGRRSTLLQVGGGLGIAGFSIGILVMLATCFGFDAALALSLVPIAMGAVGFVLTIIAGVRDAHAEGPHVAAALFINVATVVGGFLEFTAWQGWRLFA
jgi:hypothetical protein